MIDCPYQWTVEQPTTCTFRVRNGGDAVVTAGSYGVNASLSGQGHGRLVGSMPGWELQPGDSHAFSLDITPHDYESYGEKVVQIWVDQGDLIEESKESNNKDSVTVFVPKWY